MTTPHERLREAAKAVLDFIDDGDSPEVGNIAQNDLVSRAYVNLANLLEDVREALDTLPGDSWTACSERMPDSSGTYYITCQDSPGTQFVIEGYWSDAVKCWYNSVDDNYPIADRGWTATHWMKAPSLPPSPGKY